MAILELNFRLVITRQATAEVDLFPKAAVDFIAADAKLDRIYNWYDWGGYLIWRLYPNVPVLSDRRTSMATT